LTEQIAYELCEREWDGNMEQTVNQRASTEAEENASRFYHLVKSYNNFDKMEILGVIQSLLSTTDEENCFVGTYYRARGNVETLLEIKHAKHFQAAAMLARGMFELAVDIKMLETTPNAWIKMVAFNDVERLRCARKVVSFKNAHPDIDIDLSTYQQFIRLNETRIDAVRKSCWPQMKDKHHWTGIRIADRVSQLLAAECYREILELMVRRFKIDKAIKNIDFKLYVAKAFPFNDDPEIEDWLTRSIQD
jgi:hypothetical protein